MPHVSPILRDVGTAAASLDLRATGFLLSTRDSPLGTHSILK